MRVPQDDYPIDASGRIRLAIPSSGAHHRGSLRSLILAWRPFGKDSQPACWNGAVGVALLGARQEKENRKERKKDHAPSGVTHVVSALDAGDNHKHPDGITDAPGKEVARTLGCWL